MKLYAVIFDGYFKGFGSDLYCLGVFSSEEKAKEAIDFELRKLDGYYHYGIQEDFGEDFFDIIEIDLDKHQEITIFRREGETELVEYMNTDVYLGGYRI